MSEMGRFEQRQRITREMLRAERDKLFVFGDNMLRCGYGGQAAVMRGEPNAVGIPTKWRPSMEDAAFFRDFDFPTIKRDLDEAMTRLHRHMRQGGGVVWPADGVGTGLAKLPTRAPRIARYIGLCRTALEALSEASLSPAPLDPRCPSYVRRG